MKLEPPISSTVCTNQFPEPREVTVDPPRRPSCRMTTVNQITWSDERRSEVQDITADVSWDLETPQKLGYSFELTWGWPLFGDVITIL
jgi:hypothetical protein